jgi:hypothetical protein
MSGNAVAHASSTLRVGVGELARAAAESVEAAIESLTVCESVTRRSEFLHVSVVGDLLRDGEFAVRGYRSPARALSDLLGCDTFAARRRVRVAEDVCPRTTLDGQPLPPRLPATRVEFAAGKIGLRHAEVIAEALRTPAARRLDPAVWAGAEEKLAEQARLYRPSELAVFALDLITALDQDGPGADDDEPGQVNELTLSIRTGKLTGRLDGLTRELLATALDGLTRPRGEEDDRSAARRRADALGEICSRVLGSGLLPQTGGERPHLNVVIGLEELERRARSALLDHGSRLSPADLRMLACDAPVVPVVMNRAGQPLDVGRAMRTVPDGLRRAVAAPGPRMRVPRV